MSKFWEFVSNVSDDIRNDVRREVVERPWYGAPTTAPNTLFRAPETVTEAETAPAVANSNALYEEVWGEEPDTEELYGSTSLSSQSVEQGAATPQEEPEVEQDV